MAVSPDTHVVIYGDCWACDGLDELPINTVGIVAVTGDDDAAIRAASEDFARRDGDGRMSRALACYKRPLVNRLWFLRGAGKDGAEIHAGYGETVLYRIVQVKTDA